MAKNHIPGPAASCKTLAAIIKTFLIQNMRQYHLIVLIITLSIFLQESRGQNLRLVAENPLPRTNQELVINYFYSNSEIANRYEAYIENADMNNLISGSIRINDSSNTSSPFIVGPIEIRYNEINIKSDSFKIQLSKALPDTNEGIWINQVIIDGSIFIIIEERVPMARTYHKFASFNRNVFYQFNVEPYEFSTQTSSSYAKEYTERRTILLLRNIEKMKSDIDITNNFFHDLPKNQGPIELVIKKG